MMSLVAAGMLPPRTVRRRDVQSGRLSQQDLHYLKKLAARERAEETERQMATLSRAGELAATLRATEAEATLQRARRIAAQQLAARVAAAGSN
jgi:hypothetical protein